MNLAPLVLFALCPAVALPGCSIFDEQNKPLTNINVIDEQDRATNMRTVLTGGPWIHEDHEAIRVLIFRTDGTGGLAIDHTVTALGIAFTYELRENTIFITPRSDNSGKPFELVLSDNGAIHTRNAKWTGEYIRSNDAEYTPFVETLKMELVRFFGD